MNAISTNTLVKRVSESTGLDAFDTTRLIGQISGMGRAGEVEGLVNDAALDAINKKYGTGTGAASIKRALKKSGSAEGFWDTLAGMNPKVRELAEKMGLRKDMSLEELRDRFNTELQDTALNLRENLSRYGILDQTGRFNQAMLAASRSLGLIKDYDGDGTIDNRDVGIGLLKYKEAEYAKGDVTLSKEMAEHLNKLTGSNMFKEGDRVNFAFDPRTGETKMVHGKSGIYRFKQDGSLESTQYNKEGLKTLADRLDKEGHHNVASYLRRELIPRLREGEVAQVNLQQDKTGKIATADIRHGSAVYHYDAAKREWTTNIQDWDGTYGGIAINDAETYKVTGNTVSIAGTMRKGDDTWKTMLDFAKQHGDEEFMKVLESMDENKAISYEIEGDRSGRISELEVEQETEAEKKVVGRMRNIFEDVDKKSVEHSVKIGEAMQMALARDSALASFVADPGLNRYKLNANVKELAEDLAGDVAKWLSKKGTSIGSLETVAGGGFNIKIIKVGADMKSISKEEETADLLKAQYDRLIRTARAEAIKAGMNEKKAMEYITNKVGKFTQEIYDKARMLDSKDYGKDSLIP